MTAVERASSNCKLQRGYYIGTIIASVQLKKEILVVSLKGLGAKTK
jgi:hypothetical protein